MAGAASALFLLDIKGRVLVWRDYRGDVSSVQAERFFTKLIEKDVRFAYHFVHADHFVNHGVRGVCTAIDGFGFVALMR